LTALAAAAGLESGDTDAALEDWAARCVTDFLARWPGSLDEAQAGELRAEVQAAGLALSAPIGRRIAAGR
jgi:hypothetical protein